MSLDKQIAKNTVIHLAGKLISLILGLVAIAVMARYLGQEGFGYYITVTAFLQFFGILVDFGLTLTTVQMISKPGVNISRTMNSIISFRVITAFCFLLLAPILIWFFPYNIFIKLGVIITVASFFCITIIQTLTGVFQQKLKMFKLTLAEVIGRVVFVALVVLAAWLGKNIYWIFGAMSIGSIVNLVIVFLYSKKYIKWRLEFDFTIWKELISKTWPIALSISFNLIYLKMDIIILSLFRSQGEVGLYGATYRVVDILTMLPAVFMGIVLPIATKYYLEKNKKELRAILQKSFDALMIFAVPITIGTFVIAEKIMIFIAGAEFIPSGEILKVLILASCAIFATSLFAYAVVAVNRQKTMMWGYLTVAVLTLVGYFIFIPKYGYWGAAWMTVFSEALIMIWTAVLIYRAIKFFPSLKTFLKTIPAAIIMSGVLYSVRSWHVLILLMIAGVVYFGFLYLFGGIRKETIQEFVKLK
ncbi:flippase [Candidatus Falkowbacteria bacterium]|jgi:O-antigen/teichoic acid export membrane protein|nr:flippase [Candidatus Falkowbacteria bacterium]MBT5503405.1 flippase [Candidatus Falkowbacteria bacterium]MBT6574032.1 flippase [Candidatus Falkowbacteria bacterium]MBT7348602.1 flippase [Candidatus Falkowbacteria bacterium]MBT7500392.1 flippase [Candidatus Falkowbacteria bacterium]